MDNGEDSHLNHKALSHNVAEQHYCFFNRVETSIQDVWIERSICQEEKICKICKFQLVFN